MAVFRVERTGDYTVMSNFHLKDKRLSLKAKGLLSQMLSLPDDWDFAAILLRLPPKTEVHGTPVQGGEQNRIRSQTVHQEQSCWAVFLFGGDAYSVSAFQNYHRQAQPRAVRCCRGRLPKRRTAVQRVRPENKILQQEERACPR